MIEVVAKNPDGTVTMRVTVRRLAVYLENSTYRLPVAGNLI